MSKKRVVDRSGQHFAELDEELRAYLPHLVSWWSKEEEVRGVSVKARPDGGFLAVAKGYESDGSEIVAFGLGFGVIGSLMALDMTLQGGNWKVDKPWPKKS